MKNFKLITSVVLICAAIFKLCNGQCESNPCQNSGSCLALTDVKYSCVCPENFAGINCDLPAPRVTCGNQSIEIWIDKRIAIEQNLKDDSTFVYFRDTKNCGAEERNGEYYLQVDAPFLDCGVAISRTDSGKFVFKQQIVWNEVYKSVERPTVLLDFTCTYNNKYNVMTGPLVPKKIAVDFQTQYGFFTVQMDLFRGSDFSDPTSKLGIRPVVAVGQQVCVQHTLVNPMPEHLVLTLQRCWASTYQNGTGLVNSLLTDKCADDSTARVLSNGEGSQSQFCFEMFKWKDNLDSVYLNCQVNVCNLTAHGDICQCQSPDRTKRELSDTGNEMVTIHSERIHIVENLDEIWLVFMEPPDSSEYINEDGVAVTPTGNNPAPKGSNSKVLIGVGVVLVVLVITLGVAIGVFISRRSERRKQIRRNRGV